MAESYAEMQGLASEIYEKVNFGRAAPINFNGSRERRSALEQVTSHQKVLC
jgi:hypothetical protein